MPKVDVATERKSQIVKATVECITKHGYHNFSMQDVARAAGVSKGIIHYYFLNKDDLMMSVLDQVAGDIEKLLGEDMKSLTDPKQKLEVFIDVCFQIVRNTKEYYQVNMDFWTQINQKEQVRKSIANHYVKFRELAASVINEGIEKGIFNKIDAIQYSSLIIAVIDGLSLQWLFDENAFPVEDTIEKAKEIIVNGLLVKK